MKIGAHTVGVRSPIVVRIAIVIDIAEVGSRLHGYKFCPVSYPFVSFYLYINFWCIFSNPILYPYLILSIAFGVFLP